MTIIKSTNLWRGAEILSPVRDGIATGFEELDALLPGHGWPQGMLTEILSEPHTNQALHLAMPAVARLSQAGHWSAWIAPPHIPYAPGLVGQGIDLTRLLLLHVSTIKERLWALEQVLRSGFFRSVFTWIDRLEPAALRHLQLAAETGCTWGLLFRPLSAATHPSPAAVRLRVESTKKGIKICILKRRGGWPSGPIYLQLA